MSRFFIILLTTILVFACKDQSANTTKADLPKPVVVSKTSDSLPKEEKKEEVKPKSVKQIKQDLEAKGFKTFNYIDEKTKDTILMQQYFMAFLKLGPIHGQNEEEIADLQKQHLDYLRQMHDLGYADISGPFADEGDIRGITIYNVPTLKMADSLAKADPMVKAGRLNIEIRPWWAAKGFSLK